MTNWPVLEQPEALPPPGSTMRPLYALDPACSFLNHGSYGAVALPLTRHQAAWQALIEANPDHFIRDLWPVAWNKSRQALGQFLGTSGEQIGLVSNATAGLQAAAMAAPLKPGQRILITDHTYTALTNILRHVAALRGAELTVIPVPASPEAGPALLDALDRHLDERVGLAAIDHVTSPTAVRFPIEAVVEKCRAAGVPVLIDGAHGPGQVPLNLDVLGADWYVGNCHKWLGAPRGTAFIWANEARLAATNSPIISHGYGLSFEASYVRYGTMDYSAWSSLPAAIEWHGRLSETSAFSHARQVLDDAYADLLDVLEAEPVTAPGQAGPGMMASMRLPERFTAAMSEPIRLRLLEERIVGVLPPLTIQGMNRLMLRLSAYAYTSADETKKIGEALTRIGQNLADLH